MVDHWEETLRCANSCSICGVKLDPNQDRILSVYSHQPICLVCKRAEEKKKDYENTAKAMISECLMTEGKPYGDPKSYCFFHFCPYKCKT